VRSFNDFLPDFEIELIFLQLSIIKQNFRVQLWITILSVVLFLTKIIAYQFTHSLAILTDALESIVNVIAGFIGLYSLYVAAKPRDIDHPYGHGKAEFVSAAVEGALIVAAGIMIIYETILHFVEEQSHTKTRYRFIIDRHYRSINFIAGTVCMRIGKKILRLLYRQAANICRSILIQRLALLRVVVILFTKIYWLDKLIALGMAVFIIYNGYKIIRASLAGIMDEADMKLA
jgi:cation diffusion facilitator family transporter